MKILKTVLIGLLAITTIHASAQSVDEIVAKHVAAMGGKEKLSALKSLKMTGSMLAGGNVEVSITISKLHQVGMRMDMEIMGTSNYQLLNDKKGWVFFPIRGMTEPEEMDSVQYRSSINQLDVQGALFNYKEKGTNIELLGTEDIDNSPAYKLKLTYKNGHTSTYYIDIKTSRHVRSITKVPVNGTETELVNSYSDFNQNSDGFWFPYSMTNKQGTITFDKIETNVPLTENIFTN